MHGNAGQANYAAAKSAVTGLTKTIAKEWGPFGVRANTIAFGFVQTRLAFFNSFILPFIDLNWAIWYAYRLTAAKEKGENIIIDGKAVALGIPGGKQSDESKPVPGIPLGRGATPDEAARSILL